MVTSPLIDLGVAPVSPQAMIEARCSPPAVVHSPFHEIVIGGFQMRLGGLLGSSTREGIDRRFDCLRRPHT